MLPKIQTVAPLTIADARNAAVRRRILSVLAVIPNRFMDPFRRNF